MPPEEPHGLVALWLDLENGNLVCRGERVFPVDQQLTVSWYTATNSVPENYMPILEGVVFAYKDSVRDVIHVDQFNPTQIGSFYHWRDHASENGLMLALVFPSGKTFAKWEPQLVEAKRFADRIAAFWLLYPSSDNDSTVNVVWSLSDFNQELDKEVERLNRAILLSRKRETVTDFDIALSFAGEDREYVEEISNSLTAAGVRVFYDKLEEVDLWGSNLYDYLNEVYMKRARYTVMFISQWYAKKRWTNHERKSAQARALMENRDYILPIRFDGTEIPGLLPTVGYISANERSPDDIVMLILKKLEANST